MVLTIAGALLIVAVLLVLHAERWLILYWRRAPLENIAAEQGLAYVAHLPGDPEPTDRPSRARLYEDGRRLGPGNSIHDDIRRGGGGRFSVWGPNVYLSSWDGTDPRTNGRRYEIAYPVAVPPALAWSLLLLSVAAAVFAARPTWIRRAVGFLRDRAPAVAGGLVIAGFVVARLAFFLDFPVPDITIDYHSYYQVYEQMARGEWPDLSVRTPGYPLFFGPVLAVFDRVMPIIVLQNLLSLGSVLVALYCFARVDRRLAYPAALGLLGFVASPYSVWFDTALMSESLYSSLLVLAIGTLTLGVIRDGARPLACASVAMAGAALTRPAGLFLIVIYLFVVAFLLIERHPRRSILAFAVPFAAIMLLLCTYNRVRIGAFTPSPFGEMNVIGAVATFAEPDPSLPPRLNEAIGKMRGAVSVEDQKILASSWDLGKLYDVFARHYNPAIYTHLSGMGGTYLDNRQAYGAMARIAISRHPGQYLKFVAASLREFYLGPLDHPPDPYSGEGTQKRFAQIYVQREYRRVLGEDGSRGVLREYWSPPPQPHLRVAGSQIVMDRTWTRTLHQGWNAFHRVVFGSALWAGASLLLFVASLIQLGRSRLRHRGAFAAFVQLAALLGAGLLVALVELGMTRYAGPTMFLVYLAPTQLALLLLRPAERDTLGAG